MSAGEVGHRRPQPPANPAGHAPLRRPCSVRRTSSIDVVWPEGYGGRMQFDGRCRDIMTPAAGGEPLPLAEDAVRAVMAFDRTVEAIESFPARPNIGVLVGIDGGRLRHHLGDAIREDRAAGRPLYQLLDDLVGASLVAPWAWSRWTPEWRRRYFPADEEQARLLRKKRMEGVCTGFRPGSSAFDDVWGRDQSCHPVGELSHPDDQAGWHALPTPAPQASLRRARRMDAWLDGSLRLEAHFQDSALTPDGTRVAVHEYTLHADADPETLELLDVHADPRILPNPECPEAVDNIARLVGSPLPRLRALALTELRGVLGCTHLNDALRALADMPKVARALSASRRD